MVFGEVLDSSVKGWYIWKDLTFQLPERSRVSGSQMTTGREGVRVRVDRVAALFDETRGMVSELHEGLPQLQVTTMLELTLAAAQMGEAGMAEALTAYTLGVMRGEGDGLAAEVKDFALAVGEEQMKVIAAQAVLLQAGRVLLGQEDDLLVDPARLLEDFDVWVGEVVEAVEGEVELSSVPVVVVEGEPADEDDPWSEIPEWVGEWFDQVAAEWDVSIGEQQEPAVPMSLVRDYLMAGNLGESTKYAKLKKWRQRGGVEGEVKQVEGRPGNHLMLDIGNVGLLVREMVRDEMLVDGPEAVAAMIAEEELRQQLEQEFLQWQEPEWFEGWYAAHLLQVDDDRLPNGAIRVAEVQAELMGGLAETTRAGTWRKLRDTYDVESVRRGGNVEAPGVCVGREGLRKLVWAMEREQLLTPPGEENEFVGEVILLGDDEDDQPESVDRELTAGELRERIKVAINRSPLVDEADWLVELLEMMVWDATEMRVRLRWSEVIKMVEVSKPRDMAKMPQLRIGLALEEVDDLDSDRRVQVLALEGVLKYLQSVRDVDWAVLVNPRLSG